MLFIFVLLSPVALAEAPDISALTQDELFSAWRDAAGQLRASGAYPFAALKKGSVGEDVTALQTRLSQLNFYTPVTSEYDKVTTDSVKAFQKAMGVKATGNASVEDQKLLFGHTAVSQPDVEYISTKARKIKFNVKEGKIYLTGITMKIKNNTGKTIIRIIPGIKAFDADGSPVEQSLTYFPAIAEELAKGSKAIEFDTLSELYATVAYEIAPGQTATKDKNGSAAVLLAVDDVKQLEVAILGYEAKDEGIVMFPEDKVTWIPFKLK